MNTELTLYILKYGYLAIFVLIFIQEIGIPNPIPNELVLVYSGFLCSKGLLSLPLVILTSVSADFIGTNILYIVFYFLGDFILKNKPKWLPISEKAINKARQRIVNGGLWAIYVGRITPFIRGYTSVITGLLRISPQKFLPIVLLSATTWSVVCVMTGRLLGAYYMNAQGYLQKFQPYLILVAVVLVLFFAVKYFKKNLVAQTTSKLNQ